MPPSKLNIRNSSESQISNVFEPHMIGTVNECHVKAIKYGKAFEWCKHEELDEAFYVIKGQIAIDFRDGVVQMGEGDFMIVPKKIEHRPRAVSDDPIVLMYGSNNAFSTLSGGDDLMSGKFLSCESK